MIHYMTPKAERQFNSLARSYGPLRDIDTERGSVQSSVHALYVRSVGGFWLAGTLDGDRFTVYTTVASDSILKKAAPHTFSFRFGSVDFDTKTITPVKGLAQAIILVCPKLYKDDLDLTVELVRIAEDFADAI